MMVSQDLTVADVENPEKDIAFADSVVSMLCGDLGQSPGRLARSASKEGSEERKTHHRPPGSLLAEADLDAGRAELAAKLGRKPTEFEFASWLIYPKVFSGFCRTPTRET